MTRDDSAASSAEEQVCRARVLILARRTDEQVCMPIAVGAPDPSDAGAEFVGPVAAAHAKIGVARRQGPAHRTVERDRR